MYSLFLPKNFDESRPIAVLAGRGDYPICVVEKIRALGLQTKLVAFDGDTEKSLIQSFKPEDSLVTQVGQLGKVLRFLKKSGAGYALMAGQIKPKRLFKGLHPDLRAVMLLSKLKERNAETIFGSIAKAIEHVGVSMLDARCFLDDSLAEEGPMSGLKVKLSRDWIDHGIRIAKTVAQADIGQGVVVRKGTVLAVEAFEGTDAMLQRAGTFQASDSLFVKTVKRNQDFRFDIPVFGPRTLVEMVQAGIKYAALEAGNTLILHKAQLLKTAKKEGICIFGYSPL